MYSCMTNLFVCVWACPWSCVFRWTSPAGLWRSDVNWKNNHLGSDSSTNSNQGQKSMTRPRIFGHCVHGESCIMHWCYALIPVPEVTDAVTDSKHKREREWERDRCEGSELVARNETIISGMGELHLEVYCERMRREFKAGIAEVSCLISGQMRWGEIKGCAQSLPSENIATLL
jgi:hypothetical protein